MRNLTGKKFGRWNVILLAKVKQSIPIWYCRCDCGNEGLIRHPSLVAKTSRSCGCLKSDLARERWKKSNPNKTNGHFRNRRRSRTYISYSSMRQRCLNKKATSYAEYGGRGIRICRQWKKCFANFLADMGRRPRGKTLDRRDVNGNYTPKNCCWSTPVKQQRNRRCSPKHRMNREEIRRSARKCVKLFFGVARDVSGATTRS